MDLNVAESFRHRTIGFGTLGNFQEHGLFDVRNLCLRMQINRPDLESVIMLLLLTLRFRLPEKRHALSLPFRITLSMPEKPVLFYRV